MTNSIGVANQGKSLSNAEQKRHLQDGSMVAHAGDGENKTTIAACTLTNDMEEGGRP